MDGGLVGKTYSLYGGRSNSDGYYHRVRALADTLLSEGRPAEELLRLISGIVLNKRRLERISSCPGVDHEAASLIRRLHEELGEYTTVLAGHLRGLSLLQRWDRTLSMSEGQYLLAMLEIEIRNRLNADAFRSASLRLAFLPHCLHELLVNCRSERRGLDNVCKGCTATCTLSHVSKLLRRHGVVPYIWLSADLTSLLRRFAKQQERAAILGMACIPELARGMRRCARAGVPVLGVPLDANRCARWWGSPRTGSVNTRELENLLGAGTLLHPRTRFTLLT
ncbi:MAG TPA: DUF116 domain-containing protein [Bacteroidota bacterium]|nr:DUF116 domain-containing protein [Bacteroidota bacterium]